MMFVNHEYTIKFGSFQMDHLVYILKQIAKGELVHPIALFDASELLDALIAQGVPIDLRS